ncbi:MAG TPA: hypothetical protein VN231_01720 [Allosphingosinicella sp.]|nr:hypothetical protein [Allosphingosinicella sp.]
MGRLEKGLLAVAMIGIAAAAVAAETITYSYDSRGRLIKVVRTGSVNHNVAAAYAYDKADNRSNKTVTGAPK